MSAAPLPDWFFPPPRGRTADDLDRLPHSAPQHIELIDGALIVRAPQHSFHARVSMRLACEIDRQAPDDLRAQWAMTIKLGDRQRPEPDVLVHRRSAETGNDQTFYLAEDVLLVVEVVSPESEIRDRMTKPLRYAEADIPHFWLVEEEQGVPVLHVYELDPVSRRYKPTAIARELLEIGVPFPIKVDVTRLNR